MSKKSWYKRSHQFTPYTKADGQAVSDEFDDIQASFERIPEMRDDGEGFAVSPIIPEPTKPNHPVTLGMLTKTEKSVNTARDDVTEKAQQVARNAQSVATNTQTAINKANSASQSASSALESQQSANNSEDMARKWASEAEDKVIANGKCSAYHYAMKASKSAENLSIAEQSSQSNAEIAIQKAEEAKKSAEKAESHALGEIDYSKVLNVPRASTSNDGVARFTNDTGLDSEVLGLTAKAGKVIMQAINLVKLSLNNYIPLNKRSSSVSSNSEEDVATAKAVKTAYDKASEAVNAAELAQQSADNAQETVNGVIENMGELVSKNGGDIRGLLTVLGFILSNATASALFRSEQSNSAYLDFAQKNTPHSLTTIESILFEDNAAEFRLHVTPRGDNKKDRREHTFTFQPGGNIWTKKFGWLDQFFGKKPIFTYYPNHYRACSVYKIPFSDTQCLKITLFFADHNWEDNLLLPESYNGQYLVTAIDASGGLNVIGAHGVSGNEVKLISRASKKVVAVFVFGEGPL